MAEQTISRGQTSPDSSVSIAAAPTQFHHFIPQFILKNFAHKYKPPKGQGNKKRGPRKPGNKLFKGDLALHHVDLTHDDPEMEGEDQGRIRESPVKRMLGIPDMYRDTTAPATEQHAVEQMLSRLESDASLVFRRITTTFDKGKAEDGVWMTRGERNLIRKFIFLMRYRNSTFHRRFYHETDDGYEANDRGPLLEYMRGRGFARPVDVWFDNIRAIIEVDIDYGGLWMAELQESMYPMDARWAIMSIEAMFMSICCPSNPEDEFVLADNSYGVYEGPTRVSVDHRTGELVDMGWINLHEFAPLSPRLMIVLRSALLPNPQEDTIPAVKAQRDLWRRLCLDDIFGKDAQSRLADLDLHKPENSYSRVIDGARHLIEDDNDHPEKHKFLFSFVPLTTRHVDTINAVFFENATRCTSLVFKTRDALMRTLEIYMCSPPETQLFRKQATSIPGDQRLILLKKLAAVLKELGSTKTPVWEIVSPSAPASPTALNDVWDSFVRVMEGKLRLLPNERPTDGMKIYQALGGSFGTLLTDMTQAERMAMFRIKIDVWSNGLSEEIRRRNRVVINDMYDRMPRRRVWLYVKMLRARGPGPSKRARERKRAGLQPWNLNDSELKGPEDNIIKVLHMVRPEEINEMIRLTAGFN